MPYALHMISMLYTPSTSPCLCARHTVILNLWLAYQITIWQYRLPSPSSWYVVFEAFLADQYRYFTSLAVKLSFPEHKMLQECQHWWKCCHYCIPLETKQCNNLHGSHLWKHDHGHQACHDNCRAHLPHTPVHAFSMKAGQRGHTFWHSRGRRAEHDLSAPWNASSHPSCQHTANCSAHWSPGTTTGIQTNPIRMMFTNENVPNIRLEWSKGIMAWRS